MIYKNQARAEVKHIRQWLTSLNNAQLSQSKWLINSQMGSVVSIVNSLLIALLLIPLQAGGNGSLFNSYFKPTVEMDFTFSIATMEICCPFKDENIFLPLKL